MFTYLVLDIGDLPFIARSLGSERDICDPAIIYQIQNVHEII